MNPLETRLFELAAELKIPVETLRSYNRTARVVKARKAIAEILYREKYSLVQIAKAMSRDHTSISYLVHGKACRRPDPPKPWRWCFDAGQAITVLRDLVGGRQPFLVSLDLGWKLQEVGTFERAMRTNIHRIRQMEREEQERAYLQMRQKFQLRIDATCSDVEAK